MSTHHATAGEVVDLATWDRDLPAKHSKAVTKTQGLEIARLVLDADEDMQRGGYCQVSGPVVIHCLEGEIEVEIRSPELRRRLCTGQLLYLDGNTDHALKGIKQSFVLLTIVLI